MTVTVDSTDGEHFPSWEFPLDLAVFGRPGIHNAPLPKSWGGASNQDASGLTGLSPYPDTGSILLLLQVTLQL